MGPDAPFKAPRGSEPAEGVGAGGSVVKGGRDLSTREATKMDDLPEILSTRSLEKVTDQETGDLWNVPGLGRGEEELSALVTRSPSPLLAARRLWTKVAGSACRSPYPRRRMTPAWRSLRLEELLCNTKFLSNQARRLPALTFPSSVRPAVFSCHVIAVSVCGGGRGADRVCGGAG